MLNKVEVKICGITLPEQAREIAVLGADYIGCVIEFPKSPRSVSMEKAREIREAVEDCRGVACYARTVGVVVNLPFDRLNRLIEETEIRIWQLHGEEDIEYMKKVKELGVEVWKAVSDHGVGDAYMRPAIGVANLRPLQSVQGADKIVVDAKNPTHGAGGSGMLSDWDLAKQLREQGYEVVLSGGLNPENVQEGIKYVRPSIVDVSSRVELSPGVKDLEKVEKFIKNITSLSSPT